MSNFQERLHQLRKGTGLKQEDMAKELGVVFRSYRRYECGESEPTLSTLLQIAEYFHVSLDYLAGRSDAPTGGIQ
ncbi:MAG: helix-turn-helix transcriptional regulator [Oscillospiraceae bacterium]|jgi:transcriptional regulator with XRE-family HTH domain|nr:helix-turn-helix transcriptional regulator [Oscillospiraceae bacterium]